MPSNSCTCSQVATTRSARSCSSGEGVSPATSILIDSSWCLRTSLEARSSSLVIWPIIANSAIFPGPLMKRHARSGLPSRIFRMSRAASSSPSCAFSVRSRSFATVARRSSISPLLVAVRSGDPGWPRGRAALRLFLASLLTSLPPFSSAVPVVAGSDEGGAGDDLCSLAQLLYGGCEGFQALAFLPLACLLLFPPPALFGVHARGQLPEDAPAHVLPYHPTVLPATAGVVEAAALASLPGAHEVSPR